MKKYLILFLLISIAFSMASCGGSGSGSSSSPPGEDSGVPFLIELRPSQYVSQTNTFIYIRARVLNGNGNPIPNILVMFTNLSPIGSLSETSADTDGNGYAEVRLSSPTPGFSTIQAEVNTGSGQLRERRILYFSDFTLMWPQPTITLSIDADNDGIYDETSDFNFFEISTDDTAVIKAIARDEFGNNIVGMVVTFVGDTGASFPLGNTFTTNSNGEAYTTLKVSPTSVVGQETSLNIQATGSNEAVGFLTVFLQPVYITGINLFADPTGVIESEGETSTVTAYVTTSVGTIPDDLAVQFSVNPVTAGYVEPLVALTDNGTASTVFTPSAIYLGNATVRATIGSATNTVNILVADELAVVPDSQTIAGDVGGTTPAYTINGGIPPYTITTNVPGLPPTPATVLASGGTFTVTVPAGTAATTVTYTVSDSEGHTATATLDVTVVVLNPPTATITGPIVGDTYDFTISGGVPPYTPSDNSGNVSVQITGTTTLRVTVTGVPGADEDVTVTVTDNIGSTDSSILTLDVP